MRDRRPTARRWPGGLVFALLVPAAGAAQATGDAVDRLDRIQAALESGDVETAREALERWLASDASDVSGARLDRARFLQARLATDAAQAESLYRRLALEGGSEYAPMARLRLGQLRLARGRPEEAVEDFELLRADFPGHPLVAESWFWTGLARRASGRPDAACRALRRAADGAAASDRDDLSERARREAALCGTPPAGASWTVQVGAFTTREAARSQLERLDRAGQDGRLVVGADGLVRVRVGRFTREAGARALADRLRTSGWDAVVVSEDPSASGA